MLGGEATRFGRDGLTLALPDMVPGTRRLVVAEVARARAGTAALSCSTSRSCSSRGDVPARDAPRCRRWRVR